MRDLQRDWIRWTKAERISALLIMIILSIGIPTAMLGTLNASGHGPAKIGRSL